MTGLAFLLVAPPVAHHLGSLHPVEQVLTLLLAFGPFLVLGIVIMMRRRADDRAEAEDAEAQRDR